MRKKAGEAPVSLALSDCEIFVHFFAFLKKIVGLLFFLIYLYKHS